jgi:Tfp pilus assembly protein PilO
MVKNIIILVLVIIIVALGYLLLVNFPKKAEAECKTTVEQQVASAVQQYMTETQQYRRALEQVILIPACASALQQ